jgi:cell division protease FtsH
MRSLPPSLRGADPVQKISIVPRGLAALGYTLQTPTEERFLMTRGELLGRIDVLLGGRAAEEVVFGEISTGAANDLMKATDIAKRMITEFGMSEKFANVALTKEGSRFLGPASEPVMTRDYAECTQTYIDEEIARVVEERFRHVLSVLTERGTCSARSLRAPFTGTPMRLASEMMRFW